MKEFDLVIIGSGPAGYTAAFEAARYKMKTAIIERDLSRLGGVCLSEGCIPLKGLLYHARASSDYSLVRGTVMKRVEQIRSGLLSRLRGAGIELIQGEASFISPTELSVSGERIGARYFLVAAGSVPRKLFDGPDVHTSEKIFDLNPVPSRALIIGGGVIGCEYASFLSLIGVQVDIAEMLDSLLSGEDEEAVRVLAREFKKKGIGIHTKARVSVPVAGGDAVIVEGDRELRRMYDMIFETTGRRPGTAGLGLDAAGVTITDRGFIGVDENMRTSSPSIYAAGDCIDTPMLAYTAYREAESAVRHMATGASDRIDYSAMPRLVFSMPQVGSAGLSVAEAVKRNSNCRVYKYFFKAIGKAVMEGHDAGFVKLIEDPGSGAIIGASAVGDDIADIVNQLAIIVASGITAEQIRNCMFVHPSYSEIILEALHYGRQS